MNDREFFASEGPDAGRDISNTPQVEDEQIFGSSRNESGSATSIESAADIGFSDTIENELRERARKIQSVNNDPDIPDRYEDDVYRSEQRAYQAMKAVFRRGSGAFSSSAYPDASRAQWSFGRTADFADIVKYGKPDNPNFVQDNDLLPDGHPKAIRNGETPFALGMPNADEKNRIDDFMQDL